MESTNVILLGTPHELIVWLVIFVLAGIFQLFRFIIKAIKQFAETQDSAKGARPTPTQRQRRGQPPPQRRARRSAPPPVPLDYMEPPSVPDGHLSEEGAAAVQQIQRSDNRFEARQDAAYSLGKSDVLQSADSAYELGNSSRKRKAKRKAKVRFSRRREVRNAIIMREVIERPRCFDI